MINESDDSSNVAVVSISTAFYREYHISYSWLRELWAYIAISKFGQTCITWKVSEWTYTRPLQLYRNIQEPEGYQYPPGIFCGAFRCLHKLLWWLSAWHIKRLQSVPSLSTVPPNRLNWTVILVVILPSKIPPISWVANMRRGSFLKSSLSMDRKYQKYRVDSYSDAIKLYSLVKMVYSNFQKNYMTFTVDTDNEFYHIHRNELFIAELLKAFERNFAFILHTERASYDSVCGGKICNEE